ncbi:MAG: TlpA family protein disulfide reductase, partial [Actinomycetes bacterium]
ARSDRSVERRPPDRRGVAARATRAVLLALVVPAGVLLSGAVVLATLASLAGLVGWGDQRGPSPSPAAPAEPSPEPAAREAEAQVKARLTPCPASAAGSARVGRPDRLPGLTLRCLGRGTDVRMDAGRAAPTVVNLWASWCEPCRREMPRLRASADRLGSRAVFLGVDTKDDEGAAWQVLADVRVRYAQVADPDGRLLAGLGLPGIPATYVVDPRGRVVYRHVGEMDRRDITALEEAVAAAR